MVYVVSFSVFWTDFKWFVDVLARILDCRHLWDIVIVLFYLISQPAFKSGLRDSTTNSLVNKYCYTTQN